MSNPFSANVPKRQPEKPAEGPAPEADSSAEDGPAPVPEIAPVSEAAPALEALPALGMDEVSCRTCKYLDFKGTSRTAASGGECRRHAPVPGADQIASWPRVTWEGWCGEWKSGVSDEDMVKMARAIADRQADASAGGFRSAKGASPQP